MLSDNCYLNLSLNNRVHIIYIGLCTLFISSDASDEQECLRLWFTNYCRNMSSPRLASAGISLSITLSLQVSDLFAPNDILGSAISFANEIPSSISFKHQIRSRDSFGSSALSFSARIMAETSNWSAGGDFLEVGTRSWELLHNRDAELL